jgi:hypothetical protein
MRGQVVGGDLQSHSLLAPICQNHDISHAWFSIGACIGPDQGTANPLDYNPRPILPPCERLRYGGAPHIALRVNPGGDRLSSYIYGAGVAERPEGGA